MAFATSRAMRVTFVAARRRSTSTILQRASAAVLKPDSETTKIYNQMRFASTKTEGPDAEIKKNALEEELSSIRKKYLELGGAVYPSSANVVVASFGFRRAWKVPANAIEWQIEDGRLTFSTTQGTFTTAREIVGASTRGEPETNAQLTRTVRPSIHRIPRGAATALRRR